MGDGLSPEDEDIDDDEENDGMTPVTDERRT